MNVVIDPNPPKMDRKRKIVYTVVISICVLAVLLTIGVVMFNDEGEAKPVKQPIVVSTEEYLKREAEFEGIFENQTINQLEQSILIMNKINKKDGRPSPLT